MKRSPASLLIHANSDTHFLWLLLMMITQLKFIPNRMARTVYPFYRTVHQIKHQAGINCHCYAKPHVFSLHHFA